MKLTYLAALMLIISTIFFAQERSGLYVGVNYNVNTYTNPYVYVTGNQLEPTSVSGFEDNSTNFYFPCGYATYSKAGYSEFSTSAFHYLFVGALNLLNPNKEYTITTDHTYSGDSYADGYVPVLNNVTQNTSQYWNFGNNQGLEASFAEIDLFRMVYSGNFGESLLGLPFMAGFQGGVGNFGVHFARVQEGAEPGDANNDGTGLVNFNDAVDLYFGANVGYVTEIMGDDLAMLVLQYDWHFFIKGVGTETQLKGNRITLELTYFPFGEDEGFLSNLFFKGFYKHNSVPYMKKFADTISTDFSNSSVGIGVSYFLL
jgi:hypothetical protein